MKKGRHPAGGIRKGFTMTRWLVERLEGEVSFLHPHSDLIVLQETVWGGQGQRTHLLRVPHAPSGPGSFRTRTWTLSAN